VLRLFLIIALASSSAAAPPLKPAPRYYYPTTLGDKLVYALRDDDKNTEVTEIVERVEAKDAGIIVTMRRTPGDLTRKVWVTETAVLAVSEQGIDHDPPITLVKLPAKAGAEWDSTPKAARLGAVSGHKSKVVGEEEVEVPAGKFKAIRVDSIISLSGERYTVSQWYVPGVGLVKTQRAPNDREVLKSFAPGK
jgi:DUF3108-like